MKARTIPKRAIAGIHLLCAQRWPGELLVPALLDALHAVIPSARNLFDWTDAEGRLLHYFVEGPLDAELARIYFERFHNSREAACMPAFASLRGAPAGVRSARDLDHPDFYGSELYQQVWRPQGMHSRIEGVVRSRTGRLLGSLVLYRGPQDKPFTAFDEGVLAALLPSIAMALENHAAAEVSAVPAVHVPAREPSEALLLDLDGSLIHASAGASKMLMLAAGGASRVTLALAPDGLVDRLLGRTVAAARQRLLAELAAGVRSLLPWPSLSLLSAFGRFDAQTSALQPRTVGAAPLLQVALRRLEPRQVAVHRALSEMPIPAGQAAVGAALYEGLSQSEIAGRLGVAPSTVVDHARKLYCALDVPGTSGLRALVDHRIAAAA